MEVKHISITYQVYVLSLHIWLNDKFINNLLLIL